MVLSREYVISKFVVKISINTWFVFLPQHFRQERINFQSFTGSVIKITITNFGTPRATREYYDQIEKFYCVCVVRRQQAVERAWSRFVMRHDSFVRVNWNSFALRAKRRKTKRFSLSAWSSLYYHLSPYPLLRRSHLPCRVPFPSVNLPPYNPS